MARAASKQYLEYTRADSSSEFNLTNDDLIEDVCQLRQAADAGSLLGFSVMHYDSSIADEVGLHPTLKAYINGQRAATASLRSPSSFFKVNDELDRDGPLLMNHNLDSATGPKNAFVQPLLPNFGLGPSVARDEYRISTTRDTRARRGVGDEQLFFTLLPRDLNYQTISDQTTILVSTLAGGSLLAANIYMTIALAMYKKDVKDAKQKSSTFGAYDDAAVLVLCIYRRRVSGETIDHGAEWRETFREVVKRIGSKGNMRITADQQVELEVYAPPPPPNNVDRYVFELLFGTQAIANSKRDGTTAWQPLDLLFDPTNARGYAPSSCGQTFYDRALSQGRTYSTYADPDTDLPLPALDFACNESSLITWRTTTPSTRAVGNREIDSDCSLGGMSWRLTVDLDRYLQNQEAMGVTKEYVDTGVLYDFPVVITEEVVKKVNGRSMVRTMQQHFRLFSQNNVMVSLAVKDESIDSFNTFSVTDLTTERILTSSSTNTFKTRFNITSFVLGPSAARRRRDLLAAPPTALVLDQSPQFRTAVLTYDDEGDADQAYYFIPATPDSMGAYEPVSSVNCNHVYGSNGFSEAVATDASLVPGDFDSDYTGTFYSQSAVMVCVYHVGTMQNGVIAPLAPDVEVDFDMSVRYEYRFLETDGSIVSDPLKQPYLEHNNTIVFGHHVKEKLCNNNNRINDLGKIEVYLGV
eukprot:gene23553-28521_t